MAGTKVKIAAGHEINREKVCAPCGRKILDKDKRKLNYVQIDIIKERIDSDVLNMCNDKKQKDKIASELLLQKAGDKKHNHLSFFSPAFL